MNYIGGFFQTCDRDSQWLEVHFCSSRHTLDLSPAPSVTSKVEMCGLFCSVAFSWGGLSRKTEGGQLSSCQVTGGWPLLFTKGHSSCLATLPMLLFPPYWHLLLSLAPWVLGDGKASPPLRALSPNVFP